MKALRCLLGYHVWFPVDAPDSDFVLWRCTRCARHEIRTAELRWKA